jgi:iron(III) transport system substrate-binding protein
MRTPHRFLAAALALGLVTAACGSDADDTASDDTTADAAGDTTADTTNAATTEAPVTDTTDAADTTEPASDIGTVTVYSGRGEDLVGPLLELFEEETGIDTEVRYGDSAEMLLLIQEEGDNSPADVYYSQGAGFLGELSSTGALTTLPDDVVEPVPAALRSPDNDWVGLSGRARTVVYNTDELSEDDVPDSILDFTDAEWQGRIGYAPTNASFQDFVTAMRFLEGEEETRAWLEGVVANAVPYENNTAIVEAVAAGEVSVGLVNHYYLYRFLAEDPDYPAANKFYSDGDPGALINIAGAGVLATTDEEEGALALMEFLLSPTAQTYFSTETFEIPVTDDAEPSVELPALDTLSLPEFDLNQLLDLQGTVDLLIEVGAL